MVNEFHNSEKKIKINKNNPIYLKKIVKLWAWKMIT